MHLSVALRVSRACLNTHIRKTRKADNALIGFWRTLFMPCWLVINGIYDRLGSNQKYPFIASMYECIFIPVKHYIKTNFNFLFPQNRQRKLNVMTMPCVNHSSIKSTVSQELRYYLASLDNIYLNLTVLLYAGRLMDYCFTCSSKFGQTLGTYILQAVFLFGQLYVVLI